MKKKQSRIKSLITGDVDEIRRFYAEAAYPMARHTSMCATVNPENFLSDTAGTRRWWVIPVEDIDLKTLNSLDDAWIQQLWAQAHYYFVNDMDSFRLTKNERDIISKMNRQNYTTVLPLEDEINSAMDFSLPHAAWVEHTPAEIAKIVGEKHSCTIKSVSVGHVMTKLVEEGTGITKRKSNGNLLYLCPLVG